jgi:hypothetical protein
MSNEATERLQRDTQHVPLRQNAEEKSTRGTTRTNEAPGLTIFFSIFLSHRSFVDGLILESEAR